MGGAVSNWVDQVLGKKPDEPRASNGVKKSTIILYRRVFGTAEGRLVLADLLNDLDFMNMNVQSREGQVKQNVARRLLAKLGVWQPKNVWNIARGLMDLPFDFKEAGDADAADRP